jgi:hypothetical protein
MAVGVQPKPFGIQSPEQVAKIYGGNKQRIAEAMRLGIVDPTVGTLAGMFIDRMAAGAQQSQAPQGTVASQVFNPQTPPAQAPGGAGGSLLDIGAPPPDMPMPPQSPQDMQPMGPGMAEGGMVAFADGGLATLPLPDDMFNSSVGDNDVQNYAPGGVVAFADGGALDPMDIRNALRAQESSGDYGAINAEGSGAMGAYQFMPSTARALAKRLNLAYRPDLMAGSGGRSKEGQAYQERLMDAQMGDILRFSGGDIDKAAAYHFAGPNREGWGKDTRKYMADIRGRVGAPPAGASPPAAGAGGLGSLANEFPGAIKSATTEYDKLFPTPQHEAQNKLLEYVNAQASPEALKKQAYQDKWAMLAEIGFGMASSNSPYLLQAIGEAASAALPGAKKAKEARDAKSLAALQAYAQAEGITNREALERRNGIMSLAKDQMDFKNKDLERFKDIKTAEIMTDARVTSAGVAADARVLAAEKAAAAKIENAPMAQAIAAARQNILDQFAAGQAVQDPNNPKRYYRAPDGGQKPSAKFIAELARRIAYKYITTKKPDAVLPTNPWDVNRTGVNAGAGANTSVMQFDKQGNPIQ